MASSAFFQTTKKNKEIVTFGTQDTEMIFITNLYNPSIFKSPNMCLSSLSSIFIGLCRTKVVSVSFLEFPGVSGSEEVTGFSLSTITQFSLVMV